MSSQKSKAHLNLIGGKWIESPSGETFESVNPADLSDVVGSFQLSTADDADQAIAAANAAQPDWASTPPSQRADILNRAAKLMESRTRELAELLTREEGKTLAESSNEIKRAAANLTFYATQSYLIGGETLPTDEKATFLYTIRRPVGVVSVITPWNFPVTIPVRKIAPALAAGNTVVFKPASLTPMMAIKLCEILAEAGVPPGVINIVTGSASKVGSRLVQNKQVNAVTFTGSWDVGDHIQHAVGTTCRTQLEMGGKNPIVVLEDADIDLAVACTVQGAFGLSGQACTGTSRAIVAKRVVSEYTERLINATRSLKIGNGLTEGVKVGPVADKNQEETILGYVKIGKDEGAELLYGGRKLDGDGYDRGYFIEPAIFSRVQPEMRIAQEEVFGPVLAIIECDGFDDALEIANRVDYGLSASICTRDLGRAQQFVESIQAGMVKVNQPTTGVALNAPFGGMKRSSTDTFREQGSIAMEFFTRIKTVSVRYGK